MVNRIVKALENKISEAKKKGSCLIDLEMKKKVIDKRDNGMNDMLTIWFPTSVDKWLGKPQFKVAEYSEDEDCRKFDTLEEVASWIVEVYC